MHRQLYFIFLIHVFSTQFVFSQKQKFRADSIKVDKLNEAAFENRLRDASHTVRLGKLGLHVAKKIKYKQGEAEAYRTMGIGYSYLGLSDAAAKNLISALSIFKEIKDNRGLAQTYNNIGSIYRDVTAEKSIPYLKKSLQLAQREKMHSLIAGCYLNLGIAYLRNQQYDKSQAAFDKSYLLFKSLGNPLGITLSLLNGGALELYKHNISLAKKSYWKQIVEQKQLD